MSLVLVSTRSGIRTFTENGEQKTELEGRQASALVGEGSQSCLAVVDGQEIWRRFANGTWSRVATAEIPLQSLTALEGVIFAGAAEEAAMTRVSENGTLERLTGFDSVPGREAWFGVGIPLGIRSLTVTADKAAILAGVHVGGIPRSLDGGETWTPTIPIAWDVHEVCAHPTLPNLVAAAAAVGLCISNDSGENWTVFRDGFENATSLAVAVLSDEVLFSFQDGPFAKRSQVWGWRIGDGRTQPVREGLPEWLEGKVDTANIAAGAGRAAILDGGGNLWLSKENVRQWERLATGLPYSFGVLIL